ncbi:MAG: MlaE family ABC transporter permease [Alphaproteobacteria bacterium]
MKEKQASFQIDQSSSSLVLQGYWMSRHLEDASEALSHLNTNDMESLNIIDGSHLKQMDTNGAWLLISLFKKHKISPIPQLQNVSAQMLQLWERLTHLDGQIDEEPKPKTNIIYSSIAAIGEAIHQIGKEFYMVMTFIGAIFATTGRLILKPKNIRLSEISSQIYNVGFKAVGIVMLIAFSIALVIGFLMIGPLSSYGASYLTVKLVAVGILQEMGVLLTAIMIAGRTGSAFAAELGVMNVNEETAALETLGMDIYEVLVIPRIVAVIISICLLTIIADFMGLVADFIIATTMLGSTLNGFINEILALNLGYDFILGFVRAPVYGFVIGLIGCLRGLQVRSSAQEVGSNTTAAVVQSIFLVIFLHAFFALFFQITGIR